MVVRVVEVWLRSVARLEAAIRLIGVGEGLDDLQM
jgi:signal recognition particle GTPase